MRYFFGKDMSSEFINNKISIDPKNSISNSAKKLIKYLNLKQKQCFICRSKSAKKDCEIFGVSYLVCRKCSHVYVNKRFSEDSLSKYYMKNINYSSITYANKKTLKLREDIVKPKINFIKKYVKGQNWLDVGSADGAAITVCKDEGFDAVGIELSQNSRKFAKKYRKIDLYPNSLEDFNRDYSKKWDVISFFGVLEHIPEPMKILKICHSMIKKNGAVAIDVPNYNSVSTYIQKLTKNPNRHLIPHSHIMLFTLHSLEFALKRSGFKPVAVWLWGMDVIELLKYISNLDKNFPNSQLCEFLISKANEIQKVFDQERLGDDFLMIAKKI